MTRKPTKVRVPENCECANFLTRGKAYDVLSYDGSEAFSIRTDVGIISFFVLKESVSLKGANWEVVEWNDDCTAAQPEPEKPLLTFHITWLVGTTEEGAQLSTGLTVTATDMLEALTAWQLEHPKYKPLYIIER